MSSATNRRGRLAPLALIAVAGVMLAACSDNPDSPLSSVEGPGITLPETSNPDEPAPEPTTPEAPPETTAPEPPPETPATTVPAEGEDQPLTTEEWVLVILLGLLILGAVAAIAAMLGRGSKKGSTNSRQMRLDDINRMSRTVHDSSVPSVLHASDVAAIQSAWAATQHQLVDLESRVAALATDITDTEARRAVQEVANASVGVRGALESNVALRVGTDAANQTDLIENSSRTVMQRNDQLETALQRVLYMRV